MDWLRRYARHHRVLDTADAVHEDHAVRGCFSTRAWRLICRSGKAPFLPILRHPDLEWTDLVRYAEHLAGKGWQRAPDGRLLAYLLLESYRYFDRTPSIPLGDDDDALMWVCQRDGVPSLTELALVNHWSDQTRTDITRQHRWPALVRRARQWREAVTVRTRHASSTPWHFYCDRVDWRGLQLVPLRTPADLWQEGVAMHSCLYNLRFLCTRTVEASRFFSVCRQGRHIATLELRHHAPSLDGRGMERVMGRWALLDCRHAFNRLPDPDLVHSLQAFAWQYTVWSHRPRRQAGAPLPMPTQSPQSIGSALISRRHA